MAFDILQRDGLSIDILKSLSFRSRLGINLKKNLHYFDKQALFLELNEIHAWYDTKESLHTIPADYRIKSLQSALLKYYRYYPDHQAAKVFNDMLGFRSLCDNYEEISILEHNKRFRIADISHGKANDDGYRGLHVYYQLSNFHYPIEIQYNTYFDRQLNNWLHKYLYKKNYPNAVGCTLRSLYENGKIISETDFKERLNYVLSDCKKNR